MNKTFTEGIARATALTRAGNLQDATALIQSLLGRAPAAPGLWATETRLMTT